MARPLPVIANVFRCALNWTTAQGRTATNVMHFLAPSLTTATLWTALDANVTAAMWGQTALDIRVDNVHITPLDGLGATYVQVTAGTKWAGSNTAGDYILNTTMVVSLRTTNRGRRYRGRLFLPFPMETQVANGVFTNSATVTTMNSAWSAFRAAMATSTAQLVVASYGFSKKIDTRNNTITDSTWTPFATPVTTTIVESLLATQRRRQSRIRV